MTKPFQVSRGHERRWIASKRQTAPQRKTNASAMSGIAIKQL